ncbi:MAG TPA: FAD binding domain-containing protein [Devosiaceae bacterium]|nr:FAD binding domain-containing protein [Devosiaceae bacterium]
MKPAPFHYHRPSTIEEAIGILARHGSDAKPIAGGQSLGPMLNMRLARPAHVVDLNDLVELDYVRGAADWIEIGAMTRHHRVATAPEIARDFPLLAAAAATIGHYPIRQRGTLGGSLVHADPAAQLPLIAVLTNAVVLVRGPNGPREIAAAEFFQSVMTVSLASDELVTAVRFPRPPVATGWGFELFSRRRGDFAMVAVAAMLAPVGSSGVEALIALGGIGPKPLRLAPIAERLDAGSTSWAGRIASQMAALEIEDDKFIPAAFRRELASSLTEQALLAAAARMQRAHT